MATVDETGPGIPEAERSRVISRFYRSEPARQTVGNGLVAAIAKLHSAKVQLGDAPSARARFELTFRDQRWRPKFRPRIFASDRCSDVSALI
ncbi:ATP-binding protein [Methylobacterium haplocladii]|uniref:ATP-binding protein n=1 Tax=Methylobacterium haplocladii TaxID=1176176 RepID=UPI0027956EA9|nr:ATP-binding protein [Methylobacterium haplocladii]